MTSPDSSRRDDDDFPATGAASAAEEAAAIWLARLTSGETSREDLDAFERWRTADPAHESALVALRALWIGLDPAMAARLQSRPPAAVRRAPARRRWRSWALAASLVLAMALTFKTIADWRYDEVTATGQRRSVALADGSTLVLSGDTAVALDIDGARRELRLARGEVYLDVVPDADRPFLVEAGEGRVRVLGTRFSVRRTGGEMRVTVEEGSVEAGAASGDRAILTAGQRLVVRDGAAQPAVAVDPARELAWRHGRLVMSGATLEAIAGELEPHYAGVLVIANPQLRERRFNAIIDLDRIDAWLTGLGESGSVEVSRLGPFVIIR